MNMRLTVAALVAVAATGSSLAQTAYAVDTSQRLFSVNLATGNATAIGALGTVLEGLALSPTNVLYGTGSGGDVYTINTSTGAATSIGNNGLGNEEGLDFAGSNLWSTDFNSPTGLHLLDLNTGANNGTLATTITGTAARAMAFEPTFAFAYTLNDNANGGQDLWKTAGSGASTLVGTLTGAKDLVASMDFDNATGILWGLGSQGNIYQINAGTGAATATGNTGGQFWLDMSMNPNAVPEPATIAALGLGALLVIRRRRK